jgi:short-subunit dehydrogenase
VPHLLRQGRGHVVNTSSIAGLAPIPGGGNGAYTASKHAVVGLSETLVEELATIGADVGVTVLCPGPVPSRIHSAERNRPAELVSAASGGGSLPPPDFELTLEPVDAATVADQVCTAIDEGRRYVLPGPGTPEMARARIDRVLADLR